MPTACTTLTIERSRSIVQRLVNRALWSVCLTLLSMSASSLSWGLELILYQNVEDTELLHDGTCTGPACGPTQPAYADSAFFVASRPTCDRFKHALLKFDLSTVPSGTQISCVTLRLWAIRQSEYVSNVFTVARLTEPWTQTEVNWCQRSTGVEWCTPGGCFTSEGSTSVLIESGHATAQYIEWDVTAIVRSWLVDAAPNHGFVIFQEYPPGGGGGNQEVLFASTDRTNRPRYGPRLTIKSEPMPCWDIGVTPPTADTFIGHDTSCTPNPCGLGVPSFPDTDLVVAIRPPCGRDTRSFAQFDLGVLDTGTDIGCAKLRLFALRQNEYVSGSFKVQRVTEAWDQADVNFCNRTMTELWSTPGGAVSEEGVAVVTIPSKHGSFPSSGPYNEWVEWDVTDIVKAWVTHDSLNAGFMISQIAPPGAFGNQEMHFASAENPRAQWNSPRLYIHPGRSDCSTVSGVVVLPTDRRTMMAFPNPVFSGQFIHITSSDPSALGANARIFDVAGRLVQELHRTNLDQPFIWDTRRLDGSAAAPGLYAVQSDGPRGGWRGKVIVRQ